MNTLPKNSTTRTATVRARGPQWGLASGRVYRCFVGKIMPHLERENLNAEVLHYMGDCR